VKSVGLVSSLVYTGISMVVVAIFLIATLPGKYAAVERVGGAVWVFILSMIILMPVVIPLVKKRIQHVAAESDWRTSAVEGSSDDSHGGTDMAIDPVCKMEVDEKRPPGGTAEYQGKKYYFCSPGCKKAFEKDPQKYLSKGTE